MKTTDIPTVHNDQLAILKGDANDRSDKPFRCPGRR